MIGSRLLLFLIRCFSYCMYIYSMKKFFLYLMILFYLGAGINHFWNPEFYIQIMPQWLPWHKTLVLISGVFEILFGFMLVFKRTRIAAAWGIVLLLLAVFPANIQMLLNYIAQDNPHVWIAIVRLPLQVLLIWWAYIFTKPVVKS